MDTETIPKQAGSAADSESVATTDDDAVAAVSGAPSGVASENEANEANNRSASGTSSNRHSAQQTHSLTVQRSSLNSETDSLVLFDLTNKPGGTLAFSPHTIKTILDLKLLGVGYERQRLSFVQIRTELAEKISENVTVPALELSDGSHILDSWGIAEYLERHHPDGHKLFGDPATKRLAALLDEFGKTILRPHVVPLTMPEIHKLLDPESADYLANVKIGSARFQKIAGATQAERQDHVAQIAAKLGVIEAMLKSESGASEAASNGLIGEFDSLSVKGKKSLWVAGSSQPSHADFVLFGWYVFTRPAGARVIRETWLANPGVKRWVGAMLEWCGELADDLVPI